MANVTITNEDFVVQEPQLHDSVLVGVAIEPHLVRLRFKTPAKRTVCVSLNDLRGFSLETVFEKNIAFEMRVIPVTKARPSDFSRVFHQSNDVDLNDVRLAGLRSEGFVFVQVEPVLGADILALCREVTWQFDP